MTRKVCLMNLSPINYQPMSVYNNMSQQNNNVNFTAATIKNETVSYVGEVATEFAKGNLEKANKYKNFIIETLNNALKKYHPDLVLERIPFVRNGKKRDCLHLYHKKYPEIYTIPSDIFTMRNSRGPWIHYGNITVAKPEVYQLDIVAKLRNAVRNGNYSEQQVKEMNEAIDQLRIHANEMQ